MLTRPATTEGGRRNWERLVSLAASNPADPLANRQMADALAALLAEVTPMHREVLASRLMSTGAAGRIQTWRLPPGLSGDDAACRRWAAIMLLDCVDFISDTLARDHSPAERAEWRQRAARYTCGAESRRP